MSAYRKMQTQFSSRYRLRQALLAAGVEFEECPVGTEKHLVGYEGNTRPETATFIVRRAFIGGASNDVGYHWNGTTFDEIVSNFDTGKRRTLDLRQAVKREYAVLTATDAATAKGYRVRRENQTNGQVRLIVTGRV